MFWLTRPPYLRRIAAGALLVGAFLWDLHGRAGAPFPVAARALAPGEHLDATAVAWRDLPRDLLPLPDLSDAVAAVPIAAGTPLTTGLVRPTPPAPAGWWEVPVPLPPSVAAGRAVRIVLLDSLVAVDGVVAVPADRDLFATEPTGLVAVPGERAAAVAAAAAAGTIVVLLEP